MGRQPSMAAGCALGFTQAVPSALPEVGQAARRGLLSVLAGVQVGAQVAGGKLNAGRTVALMLGSSTSSSPSRAP